MRIDPNLEWLLQTLLAWLLVGVTLAGGAGWALFAARRAAQGGTPQPPLLTVCVALAVGALAPTLALFWMSLLGVPLNPASALLGTAALLLPGWALWWAAWRRGRTPHAAFGASGRRARHAARLQETTVSQTSESRPRWQRRILLLCLALVCAAVLFNAAYWVFYRDDAVLYSYMARNVWRSGALLPLNGVQTLQEGYPPLVVLLNAYIVILSGWPNDYLAGAALALLALGCLPVGYTFGAALYGRGAGWLAALLLALTPTFATWASSGYTELPTAFFLSLAALFLWRLAHKPQADDALLAGLLLGGVLWTKNAALVFVPLVGLWLLWQRHLRWQHLLLCALGGALVAAPWYLRNLLNAAPLVPPTAWTDQAQRGLDTLLVFVSRPATYSITGVLLLLGIGWALRRALRNGSAERLLLLLALPYCAVWWWSVSYDPRFLLLVLPLLSIPAAGAALWVWQRLPGGRVRLLPALLGGALLLALLVAWNSVDFKTAILQNPLMSHEVKFRYVVLGEPPPSP